MSVRHCLICNKSSPATTFIKEGTGINLICDKCWTSGKVCKHIKAEAERQEKDRTKYHIKDLKLKKMQEELASAHDEIAALKNSLEKAQTSETESRLQSDLDQKFLAYREEHQSQICLLNDLVNNSRILSREMDAKFANDMKIVSEMKALNRKMVEQSRKMDFIGVKVKNLKSDSGSGSGSSSSFHPNEQVLAELNKSLSQGLAAKGGVLQSSDTPRKVPPSKLQVAINSVTEYFSPCPRHTTRDLLDDSVYSTPENLDQMAFSTPKPKIRDFMA